jgi:DNA-binding NarL/FixJ family response regulator
MDVRMPVMDGLTAARTLLADAPAPDGDSADPGWPPRIVMVTTFDLDEYVYDALTLGASGFVLKHSSPGELAQAVRTAVAGDALLSPPLIRRLIEDVLRTSPHARRRTPAQLTARETDVLVLVARGLSNHDIGVRLVVAEQTVKSHVSHLLAKLAVRDRAQLVVYAYEAGVIVPGSPS